MEKLPIKIVSDGTVAGTQVIHAETGEPFDGVISVSWSIDATRWKEGATCALRLTNVPVEVLGMVRVTRRGER